MISARRGASALDARAPVRGEEDHEVGRVGVADEVLGSRDDPVGAVADRPGAHAAQVRTRLRLGHREALGALAGHHRPQVARPLVTLTGQQDPGRPGDDEHLQRVAGVAELALHEHPGHRVEAAAADLLGHVGGVEPRAQRRVA